MTIHSVKPGKYFHFGFKNCLLKLLDLCEHNLSSKIEVFINIDGLPLAKSSGSQVYPILCKLSVNSIVGVIGLYHGHEKRHEANDFLRMFVDEAVEILLNGIMYKESLLEIEIKGFICDVPAKSFVKYTAGHTGFMSCSKCHIKGEFKNNKTCFIEINNLIYRNDSGFRSKVQKRHHTGTSVLELLPNFDMVKKFNMSRCSKETNC